MTCPAMIGTDKPLQMYLEGDHLPNGSSASGETGAVFSGEVSSSNIDMDGCASLAFKFTSNLLPLEIPKGCFFPVKPTLQTLGGLTPMAEASHLGRVLQEWNQSDSEAKGETL